MLFPSEDQSKLDKRSLINLPIPLGWEQIGSCSRWLPKREADVSLTGGVALRKTTPLAGCRAQTRTQVFLGHPWQVLPYILHLAPSALSREERKHLIRQTDWPLWPSGGGRKEL